jgi:tRNA dimethylallyltransferase
MPSVIHVLTGPTAVGKTEWALRWAEDNQAEIVSCDSLLFYRGMDIGTAKPTAEELSRVPHHLVDVCLPSERMDVAAYVGLARKAVEGILGRERRVLVVGGSGFYLRTFLGPVTDEVEIPPEVRQRVDSLPAAEALARLRELNPQGLGGLDESNPRRVARALERCLATGRTVLDLRAAFARQRGPFADFEVRLCRLDREPTDLERRIERRVDEMLSAGLVEEVRKLRGMGFESNPSAAGAIGYRETLAMLEGQIPAAGLGGAIVRNTRALVKKQRTWFRTQLPPHRPVNAADILAPSDLFVG